MRFLTGANGAEDGLSDRLVRPRGPGHRRLQRPGRAVRKDAGCGGCRRGAGGAAHRAPEDAARRDRGRRRRCTCGRHGRHRPRQHPRRRGPCRDRDGHDRHPGQQLGRQHHAEADRRDARRLRLRDEHQHARRVLRRAGSRQAHDRAQQGRGAGHLHRRAHRQRGVDGRPARAEPDRCLRDEQGRGGAHDAGDGARMGPLRHQRQRASAPATSTPRSTTTTGRPRPARSWCRCCRASASASRRTWTRC